MRIIWKKITVAVVWTACLVAGCSTSDRKTTADGKDKEAVAREDQPKSAAASPKDKVKSSNLSGFDGAIRVNFDKDFRFVPKGWPMGLASSETRAGGLRHRPYERLSNEPSYHSTDVLYGYLRLGNAPDDKFTFIIDDLDDETWSLFVDANNNNDLTDDGPPLRNQGTGKLATTVSLEVEVITSTEKRIRRPYQLWFWVNERQEQSDVAARKPPEQRNERIQEPADSPDGLGRTKTPKFYATCHYAGEVSVNGEVYAAIAFETRNHDALYRDSGLWIDLNRDGKLDQQTEYFEDGATLRVDEKNYELRLDYP